LDAIQTVLSGELYLSRSVRTAVLESSISGTTGTVDTLSDRELEVFGYIGDGINTKEIAEKLGLSVKTVETYRTHIKDKLGLRDGSALVRKAVEWRLNGNYGLL
jgi:DNA-binding NarL/FixJ family response regulator